MITMGIDASTTSTGWAIFDGSNLIGYGVIKPKSDNWRDRLIEQGPQLANIIQTYKPEKIFMEDVPLKGSNVKALVILGAVQGFIYGVISSFNIPVFFIVPSEWRSLLGLFDGTREGTHRDMLKKKAIDKANKLFSLNLLYKSPSSKFNEDDIAEAILLCYSQIKSKRFRHD